MMPLHSKISSHRVTTTKAIKMMMMMMLMAIFGAFFFVPTAALAQDGGDNKTKNNEDNKQDSEDNLSLPLPLTSSVMFEQYDHGSLYKTHFEAPYNHNLCQPRKIHISPSTSIDNVSGLYNATVSFTIDLSKVVDDVDRDVAVAAADVDDDDDDYRSDGKVLRTRVTYGRGDSTEGSVVIYYESGDLLFFDDNKNRNRITDEYTLVRFNYTSPSNGDYYQSDLIHHVLLKNLKAGKQRYWYNIKVEQSAALPSPSPLPLPLQPNHLVQPFFPPLMKPMERPTWYYTSQKQSHQHPFFLRGSYSKNSHQSREIQQQNSKSQRREQREQEKDAESLLLLGETPMYEFTTPPLYGTPTSIALVGDLGQSKNSTRTMARILGAARAGSYERRTIGKLVSSNNNEEEEDRLVTNLFIAGDLSYADGDPKRWESWLDLAEPLLREVPMVSVPGNHEIECDKVTHDIFVPYESFFRNPNRIREAIEVPPSQEYVDAMNGYCTTSSEFIGLYDYGNAYFSYRQGLVHTIFLNSYASLLDGSKQREWLVNTALPEVDRTLTPWLLVVFHTPLYTTFSNHYGELNPELMKISGMRKIFEHARVNLIISGHDHAYLRTKPLDSNGNVVAVEDGSNKTINGTIFWTLGAGGNREGHAKYRNPTQPEDWVAERNNDEFGFGLFFAPNKTHAQLQWMRDDDDDDSDGDLFSSPGNSSLVMKDSFWIENYY